MSARAKHSQEIYAADKNIHGFGICRDGVAVHSLNRSHGQRARRRTICAIPRPSWGRMYETLVLQDKNLLQNSLSKKFLIFLSGGVMFGWKDEVALVTGAGSGIGRASALAFAKGGARTVVSDVNAQHGEETAQIIRDSGGNAVFIQADVAKPEEIRALLEQAAQHYGRLDFAFNNAGIEGAMASTADCTEENWDRIIAVNLKGVWLCMKHELQLMLAQKSGAIVNCSSIAGLVGFQNLPAYVASKHGVVGLTRAAALEYAKQGIRINAVCPGVISTAMVDRILDEHPDLPLVAGEPMARMGTPEEIAQSVVWLCSRHASFITGQALAVDGGWVAQ